MTGRLVLVGTPIGNLGDLSPRAAAAIGGADLLCCEDTRRTGRLLAHLGVRVPAMRVVNDHTEDAVLDEVLERLAAGEVVVVVSDAGMPGISDPGERLVAAAVGAGEPVEVIPGPSAGVTALVASGLPAGRHVFEGFLPRRGSGRTARLATIAGEERTTIIYEAPHRLARLIDQLLAACGPQRPVVLVRELTKLHEEHWRGTLGDAAAFVAEREPRGEYVVVLGGAPAAAEVGDDEIVAALAAARDSGLSNRDAVARVQERLGVPKRRVYHLAVGG